MLVVIIGGARSGKSRYAQSLCSGAQRVAYVATARVEDEEMRARVVRHRQDRPRSWITLEEPLEIADIVQRRAAEFEFILLDCLTLWLSNLCCALASNETDLEHRVTRELNGLVSAAASTRLVVVTNEVGCGLVPDSPLGRRFRDLQGWTNQEIAREADVVYQMVAGIASLIKLKKEEMQIQNL